MDSSWDDEYNAYEFNFLIIIPGSSYYAIYQAAVGGRSAKQVVESCNFIVILQSKSHWLCLVAKTVFLFSFPFRVITQIIGQ